MNRREESLFQKSTPDKEEIYTVSRLNGDARKVLESNFSSIWLEGEISNFSRSSSNHFYFTLKDEDSEIDAVMFYGDNRRLDFEPKDGVAVLCRGSLTVYERRGRYQFKVKEMKEAGLGKLQIRFEKLKKRLKEEGLFDDRHKKKITDFPRNIGIITSPEGAAVSDIVSTIKERYPPVSLFLFPVKVQGEEAPGEIAEAIATANEYSRATPLDMIILGRGGGSLEDLWAFNEEIVAREIFNSEVPIISAVGHEVDFSISDFVADVRVPTPTAAGKEAVPGKSQIQNQVVDFKRRIRRAEKNVLDRFKDRFRGAVRILRLRSPIHGIEEASQNLDGYVIDSIKLIENRFRSKETKYEELVKRLSLANPARLLEKGYSITMIENRPIKRADEVNKDQTIETKLNSGSLLSVVKEVKRDEE